MIPWRVKNWFSTNYPVIYHALAHSNAGQNSPAHWDAQLERTWDEPYRSWPTVNDMVAKHVMPEELLLDVGCGTGSLLRDLQARGYSRLHGLELSAYATRRLIQQGLCIHQGRLPNLPLPNATFDVVVLSQVLEHVVRRDRLLSEVKRVLKPSGRCLIFVPDNCQGPMDEPEHVVMFNAVSLSELLSRHFAVDRVVSFSDENHKMPYLAAFSCVTRR